MKNKELNIYDIEKAINFMEEFSWLIESSKNIKLKSTIETFRNLIIRNYNGDDLLTLKNTSESLITNKRFLIGVFPSLFQDVTLFPTVNSIIEFANEILNLNISEAKKRSRNETIGQIVCETNVLDDYQLERVVRALTKLLGDETKLEEVKKQKTMGNFSWNNTIQRLTENNNE